MRSHLNIKKRIKSLKFRPINERFIKFQKTRMLLALSYKLSDPKSLHLISTLEIPQLIDKIQKACNIIIKIIDNTIIFIENYKEDLLACAFDDALKRFPRERKIISVFSSSSLVECI